MTLNLTLGAHFSGWPTHRVLLGHKGRVTCLLYPHDEYPRYDKEFLVSGGADFSVKLWDIFTGDLLYTFSSHTGELLRLICTPPDCSVRDFVQRNYHPTLKLSLNGFKTELFSANCHICSF